VGILVSVLAAAAMTTGAQAASARTSTVYVQTNSAPANYVQTFTANNRGVLTAGPLFATGGAGNPSGNPPLGIPFLDSSGSVTLSDNGRLLFVVNAGDNTVSSFRVTSAGLVLADRETTGGTRPISTTSTGSDLLYVLNSASGSASISGFRVGRDGELSPIPGSILPTSTPASDLPASISFDKTGRVLVVADRGSSTLDTYVVDGDGLAHGPTSQASTGDGPFSAAFTPRDTMIVSNEHFPLVSDSTVSSYSLEPQKDATPLTLTPIDQQAANAGGACWTVITKNNKFVYVTAPFSGDIVAFPIGSDGTLGPSMNVAHPSGLTLDESLSRNGRFLYVLDSNGFSTDSVLSYRTNSNGTLSFIGQSTTFAGSAAGLSAW
jgi:6-phosphogluconolactonase (cycloisomerase 2 family)